MVNAFMSILLAFIVQVCGKAPMSSWKSDKFINELVDKLVDRAINVQSLDQADLDDSTVAKGASGRSFWGSKAPSAPKPSLSQPNVVMPPTAKMHATCMEKCMEPAPKDVKVDARIDRICMEKCLKEKVPFPGTLGSSQAPADFSSGYLQYLDKPTVETPGAAQDAAMATSSTAVLPEVPAQEVEEAARPAAKVEKATETAKIAEQEAEVAAPSAASTEKAERALKAAIQARKAAEEASFSAEEAARHGHAENAQYIGEQAGKRDVEEANPSQTELEHQDEQEDVKNAAERAAQIEAAIAGANQKGRTSAVPSKSSRNEMKSSRGRKRAARESDVSSEVFEPRKRSKSPKLAAPVFF